MNKQGLTPFTLSVWFGHFDMYTHIAETYLRDLLWTYGPDCKLQFTDLEQIDSFQMEPEELDVLSSTTNKPENLGSQRSQAEYESLKRRQNSEIPTPLHGSPGWRSAFEIIVEKELKVFAREEIFNYLVNSKWSSFGRDIYSGAIFGTYVCVLALFVAATLFRFPDSEMLRTIPPAFLPLETSYNTSTGLVTGTGPPTFDPFSDLSGQMFLVLASLGAFLLLCISWILMRTRFFHLDENHDGTISMGERSMYVFKNLASICCLITCCLLWGIVAARSHGKHDEVSSPCCCECQLCGNVPSTPEKR